MDVFRTPPDMRHWSHAHRCGGRRIVAVPTMGALHAGHLALIDTARELGDVLVVTLFVNPLQFDQRADFEHYPRTIDGDLATCASAAVDAVYAPTAAVMYPPGFDTHVEPGRLADRLEGAMRPGHFRGVCTVVTKLFQATAPHVAVFGQKDFQQLAIVRRMVTDLDMPVEIVAVPTVREHDGLALSSRNRRLSADDRAAAVAIPRALAAAAAVFDAGERRAQVVVTAARQILDDEPRARTEYVEIADAITLAPIDVITSDSVILVAARFGEVRLIDNRLLDLNDGRSHRTPAPA